jgi:hypothetical protein
MKSSVQQGGRVLFPPNTGERIYMLPFMKDIPLPKAFRRWQDTVDAMLEGISPSGEMYLMVDQAEVRAQSTHRRPGVHIDGHWDHATMEHEGRYRGDPDPSRPGPQRLLIASNVLGCRVYAGEFEGQPADGGDCSHLALDYLERIDMAPGYVWHGDAMSLLHESIPVRRDCFRTVVRINAPVQSSH